MGQLDVQHRGIDAVTPGQQRQGLPNTRRQSDHLAAIALQGLDKVQRDQRLILDHQDAAACQIAGMGLEKALAPPSVPSHVPPRGLARFDTLTLRMTLT